MATTITSAPTNAQATAYSNQKHGCTLSEGTLVVVEGDTTTNAKFYYSQNGGTSWTSYGADIAGWSNGSIAPYVDSGSTERVVAVWKQSGVGGTRTDQHLYLMVGTFNAGRTTLTWGTAKDMTTFATSGNYADVIAHAEGTGGFAHVVISYQAASTTWRSSWDINSSGVIGSETSTQLAGTYTVGVETYPSIDIDASTKRLHVAWSAGTTGAGKGIRYRTGAYSAGPTWTWATEVEVDNTRYVPNADYWLNCRWDGTRAVLGGAVYPAGGTTHDIVILDSASFTSFTSRYSVTNEPNATVIYDGGMVVDPVTGDVYLFGTNFIGGSYKNMTYKRWVRATTTIASSVITDTTARPSGSGGMSAWYSGMTLRWVYSAGSASPYSVKYDQLSLNTVPTIAFGASSLADGAFPTTTTPTLTAYVTDPDSSQTLTVTYEVATDSGFSSIVYTGTNTAASPQTAGAVSKTITALSKATLYYWRARVSDGTATSANTATRTFTIYDDPVIAIGASTPATTTSTGGPTLNVGWTYTQGQSLAEAFYRVQVQTNGGATTYYDTGTLAGPATSVALDAVALSIPTDTTGTALQVVVTTTAATTGTVVTATKVFDIQWGVVTVGIVSPSNGAIVATTGITAQWTFASTRGKLQGSYRIRLMIASTGSVLLDTGFVTSAATSAVVGVILVDGSTYSLEVTLKNDQGILGT